MDIILKTARLYYKENFTRQEIAKRLTISRVNLYRLLMKAREGWIVRIELNAPEQDYSNFEIALENKYVIGECMIVPSSDSLDIMYGVMGKALGGLGLADAQIHANSIATLPS